MPILNDPYQPNSALDFCTRLAEYPMPDNLVWQDDHLLFTSGAAVLLLDGLLDHRAEAEEILHFDSPVTAMAAAVDGSLAIGLGAAGIVVVGGEHDGQGISTFAAPGGTPTALCFADPHTLFACIVPTAGHEHHGGSLWRFDLRSTQPLCLATDLIDPAGLLLRNFDTLIVSEGGRGRLLECSTSVLRRPHVVLDDLPGHPSRLAWGSGSCVWLAIPTLSSRPGLGGGPAAQSYGLIIHLDAELVPRKSLHGSGGGRSRGITSCLEARGELIAACRADNVVVSVDLTDQWER